MLHRNSSLKEWLSWLEQLHPTEIELGLDRVSAVAKNLGLADLMQRSAGAQAPKIITVAGTNGKGSCVAALEALLVSKGESVGAFTSPHLLRYNERIKVNACELADDDICWAFEQINQARADISLSYFEFGTLAALLIFKQQAVDYYLLEVGLGGRLDAVNCVDPDVAIITSIDLDHQSWLGDTREAIAYEKAGILRQGIPFVCADKQAPLTLLDTAKKLQTKPYFFDQDFGELTAPSYGGIYYRCVEGGSAEISFVDGGAQLPVASLAAAAQAFSILGFELDACTGATLSEVKLDGRLSAVFLADNVVAFDVAHNPAAARLLAERLRAKWPDRQFNALVALMADKDLAATLEPLMPLITHWNCLALEDNPRAASPEDLAKVLKSLGVEDDLITMAPKLETVLAPLIEDAVSENIIIFGSFFTVAAAKAFLGAHCNKAGDV
ncbi:dihydrofolate synthase / folylpolyglutamate synthase [Alteromonadaceae bacterium Bs31]|nr:dihydrofolate synthase / folylpolyglutamate synthase [Alteromonadaceae bacterium Bs31]